MKGGKNMRRHKKTQMKKSLNTTTIKRHRVYVIDTIRIAFTLKGKN